MVSKQAYIDDELHTLTVIKDITFGVLYEQIKAQQNLKSLVNITLKKKIGHPLQSITNYCSQILEGHHIKEFE